MKNLEKQEIQIVSGGNWAAVYFNLGVYPGVPFSSITIPVNPTRPANITNFGYYCSCFVNCTGEWAADLLPNSWKMCTTGDTVIVQPSYKCEDYEGCQGYIGY
jgi:hypothetical protein